MKRSKWTKDGLVLTKGSNASYGYLALLLPFIILAIGYATRPVSYTHLDVYKRQRCVTRAAVENCVSISINECEAAATRSEIVSDRVACA